MRLKLEDHDRVWAQDRITCLEEMITTLDADLPHLSENGEWVAFWQEMRRLYSRASLHLRTGLAADDRRCLARGRDLWFQIRQQLTTASDDLEAGRRPA